MSSLLRSVQIFPDLKGAHDPDLSYKKFDEVQHRTSIYVAAEDIPAGTEITDPRWVIKLDNSAAYDAEQDRKEAEALRVAADAARMGFVPKGAYNPANENKYGEWYTHEGGSYGYIYPTPSTGVPLSDTSHWQQIASMGGQDLVDAAVAARDAAQGYKDAAAASAAQLAAGLLRPKGTYANLAALNAGTPTVADTNEIYITLDNGNWCYHNGSAFVAGGVYMGTGLSESRKQYENTDTTGFSPLSETARYMFPGPIPNNRYITTIDMPVFTVGSTTSYIEVWELSGDTLTRTKEIEVAVSAGAQGRIISADVSYAATGKTYISVRNLNVSAYKAFSYIIETGAEALWKTDISSTTLALSSFAVFDKLKLCGTINYRSSMWTEYNNVIEVGEGLDFEQIQDALDSTVDDTASNPYVILLYPKGTPYTRFSMIRKLNEPYPWTGSVVRNISIIGLDKAHCIVQDDSGEYSTPPSEPLTNGVIENIQFICTHDSPIGTPVKGGYAAHIDSAPLNDAGYDMEFRNCTFISYQAPAVGIGLFQDANLRFVGCDFYNYGLTSYAPNGTYANLAGYGGVFCHSDVDAGVTNQNVLFDNCNIYALDGAQGLWVATAGAFNTNDCEMTLTAYRNMCWSDKSGAEKAKVAVGITVDPKSFGNNATNLNP